MQKSPVFRRDGADIHSDLFISIAQAILGGTARTQGLYETINVTVRARARSHHCCTSVLFFLKREMAETSEQPGGRQEECWPRLGCDSAGKQFLGRVHPAGLGSGLSGAPGWLCLLSGPALRASSLLLWACHPRLLAPEPITGSAQGGRSLASFCVVFGGFGLET